jgi:hypothetical protein
MDRFWNGPNVERLRRLSRPLVAADERIEILRELDEEMNAFRREMWILCAAEAARQTCARARIPEHA